MTGTILKWGAVVLVSGMVVLGAGALFYTAVMNPRVERELREEPNGERARKVMLITLPSGRTIPVNYLREGNRVYAGADGSWWKELRGEGGRGSVFVRGETLQGHMRAVEGDPEWRKDVFSRLRPSALPGSGTLVVVELDAPDGDALADAQVERSE